jgi:signal transduction histidine kinase
VYGRLRWLAVAAAVLLIAAVELLSNTALSSVLKFPFDTLLVVAVVSVAGVIAASLDFHQIDRLTSDLVARNSELESRNAALRAVYDVSVAVSGESDPARTVDLVLGRTRELLAMDAALLLVEDSAGQVHVVAASAKDGVLRDERPLGPGLHSLAGGCPEDHLRPGFQVRVTAPVVLAEKRVGSLDLASSAAHVLAATEIETVAALATQLGLALEAARLQDELRKVAVQGERERIAREMHDGLAQVLGYVNTKSQAVDEMLADGRVADARRQLGELAGAARSLYVDVREAILSLSSPVAADRGLAVVLREYAALYAESSKLAVRFEAAPDAAAATLSRAVQTEAFRIAREALTNVRKHAHAGRVAISMTLADGMVILEVRDDGVGFDPDSLAAGPERPPHFGLAGMRERAESIGGRIEWRSGQGSGTSVEVRLPVGDDAGSSLLETAPLGATIRRAGRHQAVRSAADQASEAD